MSLETLYGGSRWAEERPKNKYTTCTRIWRFLTCRCCCKSAEPADEDPVKVEVWDEDLGDRSEIPEAFKDWLNATFKRQSTSSGGQKDKLRSSEAVYHEFLIAPPSRHILIPKPSTIRITEIGPFLGKEFGNWNFDLLRLHELTAGYSLRFVVKELFNRYDIIRAFNIHEAKLENFLNALEQGYCHRVNPYHNERHACEVVHSVHCFLSSSGISRFYTELEIFALLFAAIVHDLEHTGKTNNYHVNAYTDLALLYNDANVQENHHASSAFRILKVDQCNIVSDLNKTEFREFRRLVIQLVLATDMSSHFDQLKVVRAYLKAEKWRGTAEQAILTTMCLILHAADISNPGRSWAIHKKCADGILQEFFEQGDEEKKRGLPLSPLCDRQATDIPVTQITFIEVIVEPTLTVLGDMFDLLVKGYTEDTVMFSIRNRRKKRPKSKRSSAGLGGNEEHVNEGGPGTGSGGGRSSLPMQLYGGAVQRPDPTQQQQGCPRPWLIHLQQNKNKWRQIVGEHEKQESPGPSPGRIVTFNTNTHA